MIADFAIPGGNVDRWLLILALPDAALARLALAGDAVARHVAAMSYAERLIELGVQDNFESPLMRALHPALHAAETRKLRRRAWRKSR